MSGDVQPRKRKDKKRKREEDSVPLAFYPKDLTEDVNIHVHKEEGTGGGICAKIVFFILFSALIILIGLIITEHRGLTDLDVAESESRYSQIFEGWIDNDKHDDHTLDDHDNEHFDDEEDVHGDGHTLDDHDDEHIDDEPSEEQEHTLDDHDNEHFDDDEETSNQLSEEVEEPKQSTEKYQARDKYRYKREISEEDEDENVIESQQDEETEEEEIMAESDTNEQLSDTREQDEESDENATESQQYPEDEEESQETAELDDEQEAESDPSDDTEEQTISQEEEECDNEEVGEQKSQEDEHKSQEEDEHKSQEEDEGFNEDQDEKVTSRQESGEDQDDGVTKEKTLVEEKSEELQDVETGDQVVHEEEDTGSNSLHDSGAATDNTGLFNSRQTSPDPEESDSDKLSEDNNEYEYSSITNEDDWFIHKDLDEADKNLPDNAAKALKMFEKILEKYPSSPRGLYGLARALDTLAEIKRSNEFLEEAVTNYLKISDLNNVPDELYKAAMERCIDRVRFRGRYGKAVTVHLKLIERFPEEVKHRNQLVVSYLIMGRDQQARLVLEETLQKWPHDGCALVHYGFIWKTTYNDLIKGVHYMKKGIETNDPCAIDGRFFFHLGDALFRLGFKDEALKLYENGVNHKLFLSKYQRSLYNMPHLTARPWWEENQLKKYNLLFEELVNNWIVIRDEGLSVLNEKGYFQDESENLKDTGEWKQFELFARGRKHTKNCNKTPVTCRIIEKHPYAKDCRRGQTKFSIMHPGTHVWAHCGPTNCRLRVHLGLKVPTSTFIRVGEEIRSWRDGSLLIFDDSFEHEVWHNGTDVRLVLIVDVWHPELSVTERQTLSPL